MPSVCGVKLCLKQLAALWEIQLYDLWYFCLVDISVVVTWIASYIVLRLKISNAGSNWISYCIFVMLFEVTLFFVGV